MLRFSIGDITDVVIGRTRGDGWSWRWWEEKRRGQWIRFLSSPFFVGRWFCFSFQHGHTIWCFIVGWRFLSTAATAPSCLFFGFVIMRMHRSLVARKIRTRWWMMGFRPFENIKGFLSKRKTDGPARNNRVTTNNQSKFVTVRDKERKALAGTVILVPLQYHSFGQNSFSEIYVSPSKRTDLVLIIFHVAHMNRIFQRTNMVQKHVESYVLFLHQNKFLGFFSFYKCMIKHALNPWLKFCWDC